MAIYMTLNSVPTDLYDGQSFAEVRAGSDGYYWGDSEYLTGPNGDDTTDGRTEWDSDLSDGFDTGNVPVVIDGSSAGTTLSPQGADDGAITSPDAIVGIVHEVDLRAVVMAPDSEAIWSSIQVEFFKNHQLTQTISVPTLDAKGTADAPSQEALAIVTPNATDNDEVLITGTVRLTATEPGQPATEQMFCQAIIR